MMKHTQKSFHHLIFLYLIDFYINIFLTNGCLEWFWLI